MNKWTLALAAAGIVSMAAFASAEEAEYQALTAVSGTTISGYIDTSMNYQFGSRKVMTGRTNDGANRQNGFNLNAVKIGVGKALEDDASVWAAGYQADLLFGSDAAIYNDNLSNNVALQNAYVDLRAPIGNGLDFRVGVFESIVGYESSDSYKNPNFGRSYAFQIQPRQHTGALMMYNFDLNDWILGVRGGIANTYNSSDINGRSTWWPAYEGVGSGRLSYMGAINLIFPESTGFMEGTELYFGVVNGVDRDKGIDSPNWVNYYAGLTMPLPVTGLFFGFSYDYRGGQSEVSNDAGVVRNRSEWANAFGAYLSYNLTDKLTVANRIEYANGTVGTWDTGNTFDDNELLGETFTVSYKLWENVITRAEFRWDHDLDASGLMSTEGDRDNAFGVTANIVYMF